MSLDNRELLWEIVLCKNRKYVRDYPMILDCTAGFRKMWKGMHQDVLFMDIRKEVKPDILASNEQMPFRSNVFSKIVYDPPHLIKHQRAIQSESLMAKYIKKFSCWKSKSALLRNIARVNNEANLVLKSNGILFVKHTVTKDPSGDPIAVSYVLTLLDNFQLIRKRRQKSSGWGKSVVYYLTMMKKETRTNC